MRDERIDVKTRQAWFKRYTDAIRTLSRVLKEREEKDWENRLRQIEEYRKKQPQRWPRQDRPAKTRHILIREKGPKPRMSSIHGKIGRAWGEVPKRTRRSEHERQAACHRNYHRLLQRMAETSSYPISGENASRPEQVRRCKMGPPDRQINHDRRAKPLLRALRGRETDRHTSAQSTTESETDPPDWILHPA